MRDEQEDSELKPVFENKIRFMNTNIVVKCLDANALFVDIREEDKAVITKSFDESFDIRAHTNIWSNSF